MSKKWLFATFSRITGFASRTCSRAANPEKYENLWVFIRFDAPVVKAGIKLKGLPPLNNPALLIIWGMCQRMPFLFQAFFNGFALPCPA